MNDPHPLPDERRGGPSRPPLGEELLPPVEQPSAKFIIQLFVVPALIVLAIVGLWLGFNWLVRSTTIGPAELIRGIESGPNVARWQRASELADMLHSKRYGDLKRDQKTAGQLAQILNREIEQSTDADDQQDATLRFFLARALGEFEVADGIDVLIKAADTKRSAVDDLVRSGALEAIAVRAYNLGRRDPPEPLAHPDLEPTLVRLAGDADAQIRLKAIYALGQLGTPGALEKLEVAVDDPYPDARYNAAVALAHRGNARGVNTLAEMLDLAELSKQEPDAEAKGGDDVSFKHALVISSAIDATHALARKNPDADLSNVLKSLDELVHADAEKLRAAHVPSRIISDASRALELLKSKR